MSSLQFQTRWSQYLEGQGPMPKNTAPDLEDGEVLVSELDPLIPANLQVRVLRRRLPSGKLQDRIVGPTL